LKKVNLYGNLIACMDTLFNQVAKDVARQFLGDGTRGGTCGILHHSACG
jgi:hypothetical protein